jgi:hypothetical protein
VVEGEVLRFLDLDDGGVFFEDAPADVEDVLVVWSRSKFFAIGANVRVRRADPAEAAFMMTAVFRREMHYQGGGEGQVRVDVAQPLRRRG